MNRRSVLKNLSSFTVASTLPPFLKERVSSPDAVANPHLRKIATEEAFTIPEIAEGIRKVMRPGGANVDLLLLKQLYKSSGATPAPVQSNSNQVSDRDPAAKGVCCQSRWTWIRSWLGNMDANGVDMHVLSLGSIQPIYHDGQKK